MHNTVAYDVFMLVCWVVVGGLLGWALVDGLRQGKLWVRGGGQVYRDRNPIGFWIMALINALAVGALCFACLSAIYDLSLGLQG